MPAIYTNKILEKNKKSIRQLAYMEQEFVTLLEKHSAQSKDGMMPCTGGSEMRGYLPQRVASFFKPRKSLSFT